MKKLVVMLLVAMMVLALAISSVGCTATGECQNCHEFKEIKKHTYPSGNTIDLCPECTELFIMMGY